MVGYLTHEFVRGGEAAHSFCVGDWAGGYAVAADAYGAPFVCDGAGEGVDACFRSVYVRLEGHAGVLKCGRDADDVCAA